MSTDAPPRRPRRSPPPALPPRPVAWLEGDPRDRQPARTPSARHGRQVARHHPGRRLPDDDLVRAHRRPAGGRGRAGRRAGLPVDWGLFLLAVVGLVLAHAANNMINDYFDTTGGVDTEDYVRALYAPHPILSGWVTKRQLEIAILAVNVVGAAIMLFLAAQRGPLIIAFALAGLFVSVFYVAPPIRLKHHGLGEPGRLPRVGAVDGRRHVPGRHRDGRLVGAADVGARTPCWSRACCSASTSTRSRRTAKLGVRTLPVILGEARAPARRAVADDRCSTRSTLLLVARRLGRAVGPARRPRPAAAGATSCASSAQPKPAAPPDWYPSRGWPLWFVGFAFVHDRRAGGLLTLGLLLNALRADHAALAVGRGAVSDVRG